MVGREKPGLKHNTTEQHCTLLGCVYYMLNCAVYIRVCLYCDILQFYSQAIYVRKDTILDASIHIVIVMWASVRLVVDVCMQSEKRDSNHSSQIKE